MKYKHILFDVDGTLVDNESAVINTWQQTIEELLGKHFFGYFEYCWLM